MMIRFAKPGYLALWLSAALALANGGEELPEECGEPPNEETIAAVADSFSGYVRSLKRDVPFYHWGVRGPTRAGVNEIIDLPGPETVRGHDYFAPVDLRPRQADTRTKGAEVDIAQNYVDSLVRRYFTHGVEHQQWNIGNGLYVATDPAVSSSFGKSPAFLLEIEVRAGAKYLDLRGRGGYASFPFNDNVRDVAAGALEKGRRCTPARVNERVERVIRESVYPLRGKAIEFLSTEYTRDLMREVFRRLGVSMVAASWAATPIRSVKGPRIHEAPTL